MKLGDDPRGLTAVWTCLALVLKKEQMFLGEESVSLVSPWHVAVINISDVTISDK